MRRLAFAFGAASVLATAALAQSESDPIDTRIALMHSNGAAAGLSGGILKGEVDYSVPAGRAAIYAFGATAETFADYFPEGSHDPERSRAAPEIWEDWDGFLAQWNDFQTAVASAKEAAGEEGPADAQAFQAAVQPILDTCRSCHEDYRLPED
jgi:cytochrome c556